MPFSQNAEGLFRLMYPLDLIALIGQNDRINDFGHLFITNRRIGA
jgi:hypothetical protein